MAACLLRTLQIVYTVSYRNIACTFWEKLSHKLFPGTLALLSLSGWHHASMTNRRRHNENLRKGGNECDLWVPLKSCVYAIAASERVLRRVHACSACVLYTVSRAERPDLLTVTTRQQAKVEFIFTLFYHKYGSGLQRTCSARTRRVEMGWRLEEKWHRRGRWGVKMFRYSMQFLIPLAVQHFWQQFAATGLAAPLRKL